MLNSAFLRPCYVLHVCLSTGVCFQTLRHIRHFTLSFFHQNAARGQLHHSVGDLLTFLYVIKSRHSKILVLLFVWWLVCLLRQGCIQPTLSLNACRSCAWLPVSLAPSPECCTDRHEPPQLAKSWFLSFKTVLVRLMSTVYWESSGSSRIYGNQRAHVPKKATIPSLPVLLPQVTQASSLLC